MSFIFLVICFVALFFLTNFLQSNLGIFPKIARIYKTNITEPDDALYKTASIYLSKNIAASVSDSEYRPWLTIKAIEEGVYIAQKKSIILLFPKKCIIPWSKLTMVSEEKTALKNQYLYKVEYAKSYIYLHTKKKFDKSLYCS